MVLPYVVKAAIWILKTKYSKQKRENETKSVN